MSDMQHEIREAAHRFRQRFEQVETIGYDEVKKWLGEVEALARGLPDAPPPGDISYMPTLVLDATGYRGDNPEPQAAEPAPPMPPLEPIAGTSTERLPAGTQLAEPGEWQDWGWG